MPIVHHQDQPGLHGLAHAFAFLHANRYLREHLVPPDDGSDPVTNLNRSILDAYMQAVIEDDAILTGLRYDEESNDKTVAKAASFAHSQPVAAEQVRKMRDFLGSLFSSGAVDSDDIRRIRNFFYGPLAGEYPDKFNSVV